MVKLVNIVVFLSGILAALAVAAKITGVTADGTWDCKDNGDAYVGAVVIADTSYAFITPDGRVGSYGHLKQYGYEEQELPAFIILDGYLKDDMVAVGMSLTGPREHEHDLSGEHFLKIVISEGNQLYCSRRRAPAF